MRTDILENAMINLGSTIKPKEKMLIFDDMLFRNEDEIEEYIKNNHERFCEGVIKDNLEEKIDEIISEIEEEI